MQLSKAARYSFRKVHLKDFGFSNQKLCKWLPPADRYPKKDHPGIDRYFPQRRHHHQTNFLSAYYTNCESKCAESHFGHYNG
jgi:hypothetical protein